MYHQRTKVTHTSLLAGHFSPIWWLREATAGTGPDPPIVYFVVNHQHGTKRQEISKGRETGTSFVNEQELRVNTQCEIQHHTVNGKFDKMYCVDFFYPYLL